MEALQYSISSEMAEHDGRTDIIRGQGHVGQFPGAPRA